MDQAGIARIRSSFARLIPKKDEAGLLFYERLFATAPDVRSLFAGDRLGQARKLMDMLAIAVGALRDQAALTATLEDLGRRHQRYGARPEHYRTVGEALIWTLEKSLGPDFDAETRSAWTQLYRHVSATMEPRTQTV